MNEPTGSVAGSSMSLYFYRMGGTTANKSHDVEGLGGSNLKTTKYS